MIRGLLRHIRSFDANRVAGFLALLAIVCVVFAGAAHMAGAAPHADHGCSLCFATITTAGATLPAPVVVLVAGDANREIAPAAVVVDVAHTNVRLPAPRGPPVRA